MNWLTPLGFLGLISLIVLIIIYIIKPNYQQKFISSTYVWKLSLKYRKKKIPISQLRNILVFLCQVLAFITCACILAQPFIPGTEREDYGEKIAIIDASASMRTEIDGVTRFERAVSEVRDLLDEVVQNDGALTVILAGTEASVVIQRAGADYYNEAMDKLDKLVAMESFACTYGTPDIEGAMAQAEEVLNENPECNILFYTGSSYIDAGKVEVIDVSDVSEWNAGILDLRVVNDENYYRFEVDVACYNRDASIDVYLDVNGVNITMEQVSISTSAECVGNEVTTVVFDLESGLIESGIYSYDYAHAYINEADNFEDDNSFFRYGGARQPLKVQYYSTLANNFYSGVLMGLREAMGGYWDIEIDEIQDSEEMIQMGQGKEYAMEGYDIYIFEHMMPPTLPTDGLVILASPNSVPAGADFTMPNWYVAGSEQQLSMEEKSPLTEGMVAENMTVTRWSYIPVYDGYTPLLSCNGDPIILSKNSETEKVLIMGLNLNYSNIPLTAEFPLFFYNVLNYYFPETVEKYVYEVNDEITLNARGPQLDISGPGINKTVTTFPGSLTIQKPGTYTLLQVPLSGSDIVENFYVRIPASESNTEAVIDVLENPFFPPREEAPDLDLVFYFALALVCLLFAEWWLQSREQF